MQHDAHPMLQPTDWRKTPEDLRGSIPEDRRRIFEVIWNCALACTLKPPVLVYSRAVYATADGATHIAFTAVATGERRGYWRFRQDFPSTRFSVTPALPDAITLTVAAASTTPEVEGVRVTHVLAEMEAGTLATPASAASALHDLVEARPPWLTMSVHDHRLYASIGARASESLARWRDAGLVGLAHRNHALVESVMDGTLGYRDALVALFPDRDVAVERAAHQIDALCSTWKGLGRVEGLQAVRKEAAGVPHHEGLPTWLDPELQLPSEHPWRALRRDMEEALAVDPDWLALGDERRAAARLQWLQEQVEDADLIRHLGGSLAQFDAIRYWMTGDKAPSPKEKVVKKTGELIIDLPMPPPDELAAKQEEDGIDYDQHMLGLAPIRWKDLREVPDEPGTYTWSDKSYDFGITVRVQTDGSTLVECSRYADIIENTLRIEH